MIKTVVYSLLRLFALSGSGLTKEESHNASHGKKLSLVIASLVRTFRLGSDEGK